MFGTYRSFLALMVVALHLGGIPQIGAYAVFGFYCLSGYLMTLIMQNTYGYTILGIATYGINRFLRIYPIYWVSILISSALIWLLGSDFSASYKSSMYLPENFLELFKNIVLFFPLRESPRLTPPAWALTVEIFYYILISLGFSRNKHITIIWFAFSVLYHIFALILDLGWQRRYFTITAASLPFSTGALLFHYRQKYDHYLDKITGNTYRYFPFFLTKT